MFCVVAVGALASCLVSTGASVSLPAPVFSRVADGEGEGEGDDGEDGAEEDGADDGDASSKPAAKKSKQDKSGSASAAATAAAAAGKGQRSHEGPKPVRVLAFHPDAAQPWLILNTEEKYMHVYHRHDSYPNGGFKHIITL